MSTRDNSISLAVEMAYELIPGVCITFDELEQLWKRAAGYRKFGLKGLGVAGEPTKQATPADMLAALLAVASVGAAIPLEELRRLVNARFRK